MFDGAEARDTGPLRIGIVSTYDELCGIAGYTRALERQLRDAAEVTVLDLDQYLLRGTHARVQKLADQHIREMAVRLKSFDAVNIQLEYGTLGRTPRQIMRRLSQLVKAAPALSVTFHTILGHESFDWVLLRRHLMHGRIDHAVRMATAFFRNRGLAMRTYRLLRRRQRMHPVDIIVHTRRDARLLRDVFRLRNVEHHPLSFVSAPQAETIRLSASRSQFPLLKALPPTAKLIGSFGFLSPYKGFETALQALHHLPDDYHLLIFGGVHPNGIQREQKLDSYIRLLLDEAHIGQTILDTIGDKGAPISLSLDSRSEQLLARHPESLHGRLHFLGVHDDEGFMRAMALCDVVVLPYLEVGQSSSGPISLAMEMGCRVLASRTHAFLQYARYHPGQIEFFDIGNFAELAGLIRTDRPVPGASRQLSFNTETNAELYLRANLPRARRFGTSRLKLEAETVA